MFRQAGFTLIELMMVVLVIGMGMGLVSFAINRGSNSNLQDEAEEFIRRAEFVAEQSLLNTEVMGLFVEPRSVMNSVNDQWCYQWRRWRNYAWQEPGDVLGEHCLPVALQLELVVETEKWTYDAKRSPQPPVLVFQPSGESTRLELAIVEAANFDRRDSETVQRIEVNMLGDIRWLNREEELAANRQGR